MQCNHIALFNFIKEQQQIFSHSMVCSNAITKNSSHISNRNILLKDIMISIKFDHECNCIVIKALLPFN